MGWREEHEEKQKQLRKEVEHLIYDNPIKDLEARFFKNHGCLNFKSEEDMHEIELARMFHTWHAFQWPEKHHMHEEEPTRCYHVTTCKCGFEEAADSSD